MKTGMRKALNSPLGFAIARVSFVGFTIAVFPINPVIAGIALYVLGFFAYRWKKNENARHADHDAG
jgi:hypothetical protein